MDSVGTSHSLRRHARAHTFTGVGASEGFAAARVVWICVLWALMHSVLASKQAKDLVHRVAGPRYRNGLYRLAYNAQSVVLLLWAARLFARLPDRELYRIRAPWSWLFRASQAASLGVLLSGVQVMGMLNFAGTTSLWDFLTGKGNVRPEPEAQGPPMGDDEEVVMAGAFRFARHPGNLGALGFFLLRHHVRPQVGGVPLAIALLWYNVGYGTIAMMRGTINATDQHKRREGPALAPAAALTATNLDLLLDPFGLDLGLWEWSGDGPYAPEVKGPNGKRGVPLLNFVGWLALTTSVTVAYQRLESGRNAAYTSDPGDTGGPGSRRAAALLLLSYYLPAAAWALKRGKCK